MAGPDPFGSSLGWAWAEARRRRGEFWLATVVFTVVTLFAGVLLLGGLPNSPSPGEQITAGLESAALGVVAVVLLSLLLGLIVAPYQQRNALRRMVEEGSAGESALAEVEWLRTTLISVYDQGRSVSLADVCLALDRIGLALWQSDMTVVEKLGDEIPPVGAESGHHQAGAAILPLVGHDLVVEERVELIDHEPSPGFGIVQAAFSTNAFSGTRAVDRSYSQFRWTAFGRQVVRLLHTSQPKSATISSTDQT